MKIDRNQADATFGAEEIALKAPAHRTIIVNESCEELMILRELS
jgi:hypothetical protein